MAALRGHDQGGLMSFLTNQVAVVTGGNRGIGRGVAEALAAAGATVVLTARGQGDAERAAAEIGRGSIGLACDVRDFAEVQRLFRETGKRAGGLDVLVN